MKSDPEYIPDDLTARRQGVLRAVRRLVRLPPFPEDPESEPAVAAVTADHRQARQWSLILQAVGIAHVFRRCPRGWRLVVPGNLLAQARAELHDFDQESAAWPPPPRQHVTLAQAGEGSGPTILFLGILAIFHYVTGPWAAHSQWFLRGAVARARILMDGEWWRPVTALTLHADLVHVFGNVLIGGVLVHLVCRQIGAGLGWLGILAGGVAGNWLNILFRDTDHRSVGFSTAVFAAIGILSGLKTVRLTDWKDLLAPLGAGVGLLAVLGTSGERTDLGAHFAGLGCGLVYGAILARLPWAARLASLKIMPFAPFLLAAAMVWCWRLALAG